MLEKEDGEAYNKSRNLGNISSGDGPKFKGRGFAQLTGRYNYAEYWAFRGWLTKGKDFDIGWDVQVQNRREDRSGSVTAKLFRPPIINDPQRILDDSYSSIDTAAWYIAHFRSKTIAAIDQDDVRAATLAINGGDGSSAWAKNAKLDARISFVNRFKKVML
jgi:predicted chitinase